MRDKWLIGTDLDGTLLGSKEKSFFNLPEGNKIALEKAKEAGHIHAIVTGRQWEFAKPVYDLVDIGGPIILNNGSRILYEEMNIDYRYYIDMETVFNIFTKAKEQNVLKTFVLVGAETSYVDKAEDGFDMSFEKYTSTTVVEVEDFKDLQDKVMAGVIGLDFEDEEKGFEFIEEMIEHHGDVLNITRFNLKAGRLDFQFYSTETNKYIAMEKLAELLDIQKKNIMTFGDQMNDLEFVRDAAVGVAMQNANPDLKEIATQITQYNNEESGVGRHIEMFFKL